MTERNMRAAQLKQAKFEKLGLYYTMQSVLGVNWATWIWLCGARGRGKSFAAVETLLRLRKKYGAENVKAYWFRLSDLSVKALLANKGAKAIDSILVRKYNLDITTRAGRIYDHGVPLVDCYALVSAAKAGKGIAEYDPEFLNNRPNGIKRYIYIILDEFQMQENLEKRTVGNPVDQFKLFIENILRDQERLDYPAVKIVGCANAVSECSDFLAQLAGFIPEEPGRYFLKRKHMIIDNIPNSQAYIEKRKKSIGADIMNYDEDSNYTNVIKRDLETLAPKNKRYLKVTNLIKFSKDTKDWYCLYDGQCLRKYRGETVSKSIVIAMKRYLDSFFDQDLVKNIIERYDARGFLYSDLITQATFAANLKIIKNK